MHALHYHSQSALANAASIVLDLPIDGQSKQSVFLLLIIDVPNDVIAVNTFNKMHLLLSLLVLYFPDLAVAR